VVPSGVTRSLFDAIIESGRQYSQKHHSKSPLMYSYYRTEYLGKYIVHSVDWDNIDGRSSNILVIPGIWA